MSDYKVNFREMKSRVGIDDIAYALGYRLDRKAGVGRYIELVLGEGQIVPPLDGKAVKVGVPRRVGDLRRGDRRGGGVHRLLDGRL